MRASIAQTLRTTFRLAKFESSDLDRGETSSSELACRFTRPETSFRVFPLVCVSWIG